MHTIDNRFIAYGGRSFPVRRLFAAFRARWRARSGFNTVSTYAEFSERNLFGSRSCPDGALMDSLDILSGYIDDLLTVRAEDANHDIHLAAQLEMKKTEMAPLLPDSRGSLPTADGNHLLSIYQAVMGILNDFLRLQELFRLDGGISRFQTVVHSEASAISVLRRYGRRILYLNGPDSTLAALCATALDEFADHVRALSVEENPGGATATQTEIFTVLRRVGERNARIRQSILELFSGSSASGADSTAGRGDT